MRLIARRITVAFTLVGGFTSAGTAAQIGPKHVIQIALKEGKILSAAAENSGGMPVVRVRQGQALVLRWRTDVSVTIHLHGYDIEILVPRDGEAAMDFVARAAGRFPVERHGSAGHKVLLYLEVRP
jgi:hypothetical protein